MLIVTGINPLLGLQQVFENLAQLSSISHYSATYTKSVSILDQNNSNLENAQVLQKEILLKAEYFLDFVRLKEC